MAFLNNNQWISMAFWYILWCVKEWGSRWVPQVGLPPWCHFQLVPGTAAATADGGPATPLAFGAIWSCGTVFSQVFFLFLSIGTWRDVCFLDSLGWRWWWWWWWRKMVELLQALIEFGHIWAFMKGIVALPGRPWEVYVPMFMGRKERSWIIIDWLSLSRRGRTTIPFPN